MESLRVNQGKLLEIGFFASPAQIRTFADAFRLGEEQNVLSVEPLHLFVVPNPSTNAIDGHVIVDLEEARPIIRPLLVQMLSAPLKGNRRREEHHGREFCKAVNETRRGLRWKMLRNFQGYSQIERARKVERRRQVGRPELILRDLKLVTVDIIAVKSYHVVHTQLPKHREPGSIAAADINDGFGLD